MRQVNVDLSGRCLKDTVSAFLRLAIEQAGDASVLWVSLPCPYLRLSDVQRLLPHDDHGFIYQPTRGGGFSGMGALARFDASGRDRMAALQQWAAGLFDQVVTAAWPGLPATLPSVHGGMSFAPEGPTDGEWRHFGDGVFVLPRWLYSAEGLLPCLCRAIELGARPIEEEAEELWQVLEHLDEMSGVTPPPVDRRSARSVDDVEQQPFEVWSELIHGIHAAIADDGFDKLVAARRAVIRGGEPFDALHVYERLEQEYPRCNLFMVRHHDASFVGATPENLFVKKGRELVTHALAGSKFLGTLDGPASETAARELLGSRKDRWEHDVVVQRIIEALEPLAIRVEHPEEPGTIRVRNIMHLNTPVRAVLGNDTHSTSLVEALHPTPAVGGLPKWEAVDWIVANEPGHRGWYTGTVGWFDAHDNAEFAVAIRCGVVQAGEASLYAGAGVVADSTAQAEYDETSLKQQPMLRALGVDL